MAKFVSKRVSSAVTDKFTETLEFTVLHCGNVVGNNNKFYCIEIQKNPEDHYRLFTHYGRLGESNVYEVRDVNADGSPITNFDEVKKEYESIIKSKTRAKSAKSSSGEDIVAQYHRVETVAPTIGSNNIRSKQVVTKVDTKTNIDISNFVEPNVSRILDLFIKENIHNICTQTSLTLTANGFETPLGPVTLEHIAKARDPLNNLKALLNGENIPITDSSVAFNNLYFSLIPHKFGRYITKSDWIIDVDKLLSEFEVLDQLETAIQMGSSMNNVNADRLNALGSEIELVTDKDLIKRYTDKFEKSRAKNHSNLSKWKVANVYKVVIPEERKRHDKAKDNYGNMEELFHGSRNCNILSILKGGLIIPPANAGFCTGRMFGNGIYGASSGTKSLNYSVGYWGGSKSKVNTSFLFIADFAMGKRYEAYSSLPSGVPSGYHSIHAKAGKSLINDEFIVPKLEQVTIKYLIELEER